MREFICIFTLIFSMLCIGCYEKKATLAGDYYLRDEGETRSSIIVAKPGNDDVGGVFEGSISKIAWNKNKIVAFVTPHYKGSSIGWYSLDVNTGIISGPFDRFPASTNDNLIIHDSTQILEGRSSHGLPDN